MRGAYIESYKDLYHGTTKANAENIIVSQEFIPSREGWCGPGVYFYDNRSKAWWSAARTCDYEKRKGNVNVSPEIVIADITTLEKKFILDLRSPDDLNEFAEFVNNFFSVCDFRIEEDLCEEKLLIRKRALLLNFYCKEKDIQLIIGHFKQRGQKRVENSQEFAETWQLAIGVETIYCAKNPTIVCNIRGR